MITSMMAASDQHDGGPVQYINRDHSTFQYVFILTSVSMCITVDILQYSMPLAFLPSVLEDRGHSPEMIATAIGVYYWTGLLGGLVVTSYECWKLFYVRDTHEVDITPFPTVQRQIKLIIMNLGIGVITLFIQANNPRWHVHTACRFVQGFVGAFLFFYVFLLNVAVFKGQQQVVAMTFASCATVLAELAGPLLGSVLYDAYGQRTVFWFLGVVSFMNQLALVACYYMVRSTTDVSSESVDRSRESSPMLHSSCADAAAAGPQNKELEESSSWMTPVPGSKAKMLALLQNPTFICANLLIVTAGLIKGSVEEMLPFYADHQWGYDPVTIGQLFCTTAVAYFMAAGIVASAWTSLGRFQTSFSAQFLVLMGVTAWMGFHVAFYYKNEAALFGAFAAYGFCAGLAFTAAAQLIAEVVDKAEGHAKDAANGIWNTAWEFGGSSGFAMGGFLAHHYHEQMSLTTCYMLVCVVVAGVMLALGFKAPEKLPGKMGKTADYGSTATA